MGVAKTIYCPRCKRAVMTYDGRSTINKTGICKKCNKRVIYDVETQEVRLRNLDYRKCASGVTFGR